MLFPVGVMAWREAFAYELARKEKESATTSETKSQHEQKGFLWFLS
jgi:hypothetical protein